MKEPSPRASRLAIAGLCVAVALVGGSGFLLGRATTERPVAPAARPGSAVPRPAPAPAPVAPAPTDRTMDRADLLALVAAASDAVATGAAIPAEVTRADGRRFEIRLPFGCDGPADAQSDAPMRWRYDGEDNTLRIHVAPVAWRADDWLSPAPPETIEAVEGFWIPRPWTMSDACPPAGGNAMPAAAPPTIPPEQTVAIAQFFAAGGARQARRGSKPFETVVRLQPEALRAERGFRLRISGRLAALGDRGPVLCRQPAGAAQRPVCMIGMTADALSIENAATDEMLANWTFEHREAVDR